MISALERIIFPDFSIERAKSEEDKDVLPLPASGSMLNIELGGSITNLKNPDDEFSFVIVRTNIVIEILRDELKMLKANLTSLAYFKVAKEREIEIQQDNINAREFFLVTYPISMLHMKKELEHAGVYNIPLSISLPEKAFIE